MLLKYFIFFDFMCIFLSKNKKMALIYVKEIEIETILLYTHIIKKEKIWKTLKKRLNKTS